MVADCSELTVARQKPMAKGFALAPLIVVTAFLPAPAKANTCVAKGLKVKHVCGIGVDGSGVPIQGATLQITSDKNEPLIPQTVTQDDGRFSIEMYRKVTFLSPFPLRNTTTASGH